MKAEYTANTRMLARIVCTSVLAFMLTGCVSTPERSSVPVELTNQAGIPGVPDARFWGDEWPTFAFERFQAYTDAELRRDFSTTYN